MADQVKQDATQEQNTEGQGGGDTSQAAAAAARADGNQGDQTQTDTEDGQARDQEPQGGEQEGERKGDPRIALRQARAKIKRMSKELERVKGNDGASEQGEGANEEGMPDFTVTEEEADDPEALTRKMQQLYTQAVSSATEKVRSEMSASEDVESEAQSIFEQYEVFNQDDEIGEYATRAAADRISELPAGSSIEEVRDVVQQVAKDFDKLRAQKTKEGEGGDTDTSEGPVTVGAGAAETAHLHPEAAPQGSLKEAGQKAKQEFQQRLTRTQNR